MLEVRGRGPGCLAPPPVSWAGSPPPRGLVAVPRDLHLQGDMKVTVTVTDEAQKSLGAGFLEL